MTKPDGLYQRAQTRATPLLSKLADLSEEDWDELTHRMRKHFTREMAVRGLVFVRAGSGGVFPDGTTNHPPIDFEEG